MIDYTSNKIRWEKYIERRNTIFYVSIFNTAYGKRLREITGFGFHHQLYSLKNGVFTFFKSKDELEKAREHFRNESLAKKLLIICKKYEKKENYLVKKFQNLDLLFISKNYSNIIKELIDIFTYLTTIPMLIINAFESDYGKTDTSTNIVEQFLYFRKKSRNPLQESVINNFFIAAHRKDRTYPIDDYSFFTYGELGEVLYKGEVVSVSEIEKRKKRCVFYDDNNKLVFNYNGDFLKRIMVVKEKMARDVIHGTSAFRGTVSGKVCVINKPYEMKKFRNGDIVVSVNTTPALMPVLMKARGIVTDEGGLTCHAAIISRELKIPCVVGTKNATKHFKDGDMIKVDANAGVVRKILS